MREATEEEKRILYFDWETRYVMPIDHGEDFVKGDQVGAEVKQNGEWITLLPPIRSPKHDRGQR